MPKSLRSAGQRRVRSHPHLWSGGLRGPLLPHLSQAASCRTLGPGSGPCPAVPLPALRHPAAWGSRPSRPPAVEALLLPGPCTPRKRPACCQPAAPPEPCTPWQPPGGPERPCTARRRRLRLSTAASSKQASGAACRGSGRVAWAAVPSARESRSRLFSVEKTGNFARLRQAAPDTPRLTGRRHPLSRRKWKQLPIFACRRRTTACLLWPAGTTNQLHRVFLHHTVSEADSLGLRRQEARPI